MIKEIPLTADLFLKQSTLILGGSDTGKTFLTSDILYLLKPFVEQIVVFCPSDRQNRDYEKLIPLPLIYYEVNVDIVNNIFERQKALTTISKQANNPRVLESLFNRIATEFEQRSAARIRVLQEESSSKSLDDTAQKSNELLIHLYKGVIERNRRALEGMNLSDEELKSLKYHAMNPHMIVIFDDCTSVLTEMCNNPRMQEYFYQGRHASLTILIAAHTDKKIKPELRKSIYKFIFTESQSARSYFTRGSNEFDTHYKRVANDAINETMPEDPPAAIKYQKLMWNQKSKTFSRITATMRGSFRFCAPHIEEFCRKIERPSVDIGRENKFFSKFYV